MHILVGNSTAEETLGITGAQKQNVTASAAPVLTEGAHVWLGGTGATRDHQGAIPTGLSRHSGGQGSVTGLCAVLCSLNFKSNKVKLQYIKSRNEQRLQRSWKLFNL